ncbi:MAG: inorganic diphosphatase, partial [Verrucomicrobiae bacterium]|nr:inorganic diphosphatase [Verrucomicrobiae bacterium]
IGGLGTIDGGRSDDKIIAVLVNDDIWGKAERLSDIPAPFIDRLHHYFSTYKMRPGEPSAVTITSTYDADHAGEVVRAAIEDYQNEYPEV